jgi:hypothetical protein
MRCRRIRYDREDCYYHLMNRIAGEPGEFPFGKVEKETFLRLAVDLSRFYSLDLLSVVVMGNHYHVVCSAPAEAPGKEEVIANWRAFRGSGPTVIEPDWENEEVVAQLAGRMRDISKFIKDLQQRFTCWFNRTRPKGRRGGLWADRFKNIILEGSTALWDCLTYVEMNPVRAGLAESPGDYRFSTWGRMVGGGTHPFAGNLVRHLRQYLGECAEGWSDTSGSLPNWPPTWPASPLASAAKTARPSLPKRKPPAIPATASPSRSAAASATGQTGP